MTDLSLSEARRVALAAQGFDRPRPKRRPGPRDLGRVIRQLGLLQIDFVNVLAPAHYQVPSSRLGPSPRAQLDELVYPRRQAKAPAPPFTEQWAHEASIVPVETWPLLRHRMERHRVRPWGFEKIMEENPAYIDWVLDQVRTRGPLVAGDLREPDAAMRRIPGAWFGSVPRAALEAHFGRGLLGIADRRPNFARAYDLAEHIVPPQHHARRGDREEAQRELLRLSGRAPGLAGAARLARYFRQPTHETRPPPIWPIITACQSAKRARVLPNWWKPATCAKRGWRDGARRLICIARRVCREPSMPRVCSRPSTRWCGTARARSASFNSNTGSRSSCRSPSAGGVITCCRSCWGSAWWRAWI